MIEGYKQLLNSINLHRHLKELAEEEYKYNQDLFEKNRYMATKGTISNKPLDRIVEDLKHNESLIYIENERIKHLEEKKKIIDDCIDQSEIPVKVVKLRAMGLTQEQVAELVNISDRHVRRIEAKIKES